MLDDTGLRTYMAVVLLVACAEPPVATIDRDGDGSLSDVDCDDADPGIHPRAPERCDGVDQDCDGDIDEQAVDALDVFEDLDDDGFGGQAIRACELGDHTTLPGDCDDTDPDVNPDAQERCDPIDRNCDGDPHHGAPDGERIYDDLDGDGFPGTYVGVRCTVPEGASLVREDCDDDDAATYPGAPERCDRIDQDCDNQLGFDAVVGERFPDVPGAVDRVPDGGTVCVLAGEWPGRIYVEDKDVTIVGEGAGRTVLVADRYVANAYRSDLTLRDLSVSGTIGAPVAAVRTQYGDLVLDGVTFEDIVPSPEYSASLVHARGGDLTLRDVRVHDLAPGPNSPVVALFWADSGSLHLRDVTFENLELVSRRYSAASLIVASGDEVSGGGLVVRDVVWTPLEGEPTYGGGLLHAGSASVELTDVVVQDVDLEVGGSLIAAGWRPVELRDVTLERVQLDSVDGGLIRSSGELGIDGLTVRDSTFSDGWGALVRGAARSDISMQHVRLEGVTTDGVAGLIYTGDWPFVGSVYVRNLVSLQGRYVGAEYYPGVFFSAPSGRPAAEAHGSLTLTNAVLLDDVVDGTGTGTLFGGSRVDVSLINVHLGAAWTASTDDPPLVLDSTGIGACTLDHLTLEGSPQDLLAGLDPDRLDVRFLVTRTEPGFVDTRGSDASTWDLHLRADSPLRDAGSPDLSDPDGSRSDVGAYGGPAGAW